MMEQVGVHLSVPSPMHKRSYESITPSEVLQMQGNLNSVVVAGTTLARRT